MRVSILFLLLFSSQLTNGAEATCKVGKTCDAEKNATYRALDSMNKIEMAQPIYTKTKEKEKDNKDAASVIETNLRRFSESIRCPWRDESHCAKANGAECRFLLSAKKNEGEKYRKICTELDRLIDAAEAAADGEDEEYDIKERLTEGLTEEFKVGGFFEIRKEIEAFISQSKQARSTVTGETKKKVNEGVTLAAKLKPKSIE